MKDIKQYKAFALIEILLAELLIGIISVSALNLQTYTIKTIHRIYETSLAIVRLSSLLEQFYLIRGEGRNMLYEQWMQENSVLLPNWQSDYACLEKHCTIKLYILQPYKEKLSLTI